MNIVYDKELMVFKQDGKFGPMYSVGLSKKTQDDKYESAYLPCRFRKGVELQNKTKIRIKNAWLTFNKKEDKTYFYIFINSFEELYTKEEPKEEPKIEEQKKEDPYSQFQEEHGEEIMELPF